jgi:hypothetical protein
MFLLRASGRGMEQNSRNVSLAFWAFFASCIAPAYCDRAIFLGLIKPCCNFSAVI